MSEVYMYKRRPERELDHESTVPWYKKIFCKHEYTNYCYNIYYPDIAYQYCCKCEEWHRTSTRGSTTRLLKHMAGIK